ncbi:MAG: class II aldolase/adducin family protein [Planctomycetota bacterium]|jgi:L-fuculose-phosphate aldolase
MERKRLDLGGQVIDTAMAMNRLGINQGETGNVSVRYAEGFLITPSGLPYEQLRPEQIVYVHMTGDHEGSLRPSSEWRMHRDSYANFEDVHAVIHAHAPHATALACLREELPAFHYMVAVAGGTSIPCAPYAPFGTQALSDALVEIIRGKKACLLAHHGLLVHEASLAKALSLATTVESLARVYAIVRATGEPILLTEEQMADVLERFETYGRQN